MPATSEQSKKYRQRLRERAFNSIGWTCIFCGTGEKIHAAHVIETGLRGPSRGMDRRFRDVIKNPQSYAPMCHKHHMVYDKLKRRSTIRPANEEPIPF